MHGTKNVLAPVRSAGTGSGFRSTVMVGSGRDHPGLLSQLVDRLPQRLVLIHPYSKRI